MLGFTPKQLEARAALLEPGVTTYALAALRLGITENAVKKRMGASGMQVVKAKQVIKEDEDWRRKRRLNKQGKLPQDVQTV